MNKNRIEWVDGAKGIACLLIFLHHFLLVFYPAIHYGEGVPSWFHNIDVALAQSPVSVIVNANQELNLSNASENIANAIRPKICRSRP